MRTNYMMTVDDVMEELGVKRSKAYSILKQLNDELVKEGYGIDRLPEPHLMAQEFIDYVTARGGICISAHPYRANSRGLGDMLFTLKGMTGVEVLNGSTTPLENRKALDTCIKTGLKQFGASDAHSTVQVGIYATEIQGYFTTVPELVEAIKTRECRAVYLKPFSCCHAVCRLF